MAMLRSSVRAYWYGVRHPEYSRRSSAPRYRPGSLYRKTTSHLRHRGQQWQTAVIGRNSFIGDRGRAGCEQRFSLGGIRGKVQIGEQHLPRAQHCALMELRFFDNEAGLPGNVFVQIGLHREVESELTRFEDAVRDIPEVMECYLMPGEFDYLVRVVVADMADFERIHKTRLTRLPGVARVNSSFGIRTVQRKTKLPLRWHQLETGNC